MSARMAGNGLCFFKACYSHRYWPLVRLGWLAIKDTVTTTTTTRGCYIASAARPVGAAKQALTRPGCQCCVSVWAVCCMIVALR